MAWEWSHTPEAYENARRNLQDLPRRDLLVILREWAYYDRAAAHTLRTRTGHRRPAGFRLPNGIRRLSTDGLADLVWDRAAALQRCTNGGWDAYVCPDGCHTVSFDRSEEEGPC